MLKKAEGEALEEHPQSPLKQPETQAEPSNQKEVQREEEEALEAAQKAAEDSAKDLKEKAQIYWDQLLRLQADFANYRRRTEKEKADAIRFGREAILERMISLNDVMEEALKYSHNAADLSSLKRGFEMILREFSRFLKQEGAEPIKSVGEVFDPRLHEAIEQIETEKESENNVILEELQKGYSLNGRLLRPAKVKVAKCLKKEGHKEEKEEKQP